jgi:hypothetical protein
MAGPLEAVPEIRERLPLTLRNIDDGPLKGGVGDLGALTINARNVDSGPLGPHGRGVWSPSEIQKMRCKPAWA